jgi:hypothetical protein
MHMNRQKGQRRRQKGSFCLAYNLKAGSTSSPVIPLLPQTQRDTQSVIAVRKPPVVLQAGKYPADDRTLFTASPPPLPHLSTVRRLQLALERERPLPLLTNSHFAPERKERKGSRERPWHREQDVMREESQDRERRGAAKNEIDKEDACFGAK